MTSIAVQDLKRPRELRELLVTENEIIVTKDGRPFAVMVGVDAESVNDTLREVRRALFSSAVLRARRRARGILVSDADIAGEIANARKQRHS